MTEDKEDDALAGDHVGEDDGAWLDINVPQLVHDQLAAWGARVGLTADGYAKVILLQGMHPLLDGSDQAQAPAQSDGDTSRQLWADQLQKYRSAEDLAPPPVASDEAQGWRTYSATDFDWGTDAPPAHSYATVDRTGALTVSEQPPRPAPAI